MNNKPYPELIGLGSSSLLVLGNAGLKRMYCPFRVICLRPVSSLFPGDVLFVAHVEQSPGLKLAYKISGKYYPYYFFEILDS